MLTRSERLAHKAHCDCTAVLVCSVPGMRMASPADLSQGLSARMTCNREESSLAEEVLLVLQ
eukprot:299976-Amphidinium_carterae.2